MKTSLWAEPFWGTPKGGIVGMRGESLYLGVSVSVRGMTVSGGISSREKLTVKRQFSLS